MSLFEKLPGAVQSELVDGAAKLAGRLWRSLTGKADHPQLRQVARAAAAELGERALHEIGVDLGPIVLAAKLRELQALQPAIAAQQSGNEALMKAMREYDAALAAKNEELEVKDKRIAELEAKVADLEADAAETERDR